MWKGDRRAATDKLMSSRQKQAQSLQTPGRGWKQPWSCPTPGASELVCLPTTPILSD